MPLPSTLPDGWSKCRRKLRHSFEFAGPNALWRIDVTRVTNVPSEEEEQGGEVENDIYELEFELIDSVWAEMQADRGKIDEAGTTIKHMTTRVCGIRGNDIHASRIGRQFCQLYADYLGSFALPLDPVPKESLHDLRSVRASTLSLSLSLSLSWSISHVDWCM